jgi:hypothetical protein
MTTIKPPLTQPQGKAGNRKEIRMSRPANDEMVQGFMDGFDLTAPEPSANRSASYRHGFLNGRADKTGKSRGLSFSELNKLADEAMWNDELQGLPMSGER